MTFTEAALEVLRSVGEPLHYKRITELAIERNLLSHVGKTPEVTMSSRLATMVKKDRGSAPIIKVKPGVFAIRADAKLDAATLAEVAALEAMSDAECVEVASEPSIAPEVPEEQAALPGADVFPEEEDDDDPILAGLEGDEGDGGEDRGRRRRRRRRRGKGGDLASAEDNGASNGDGRGRDRERGRERSERERDRGERERDRGRRHEAREPRESNSRVELTREPADGDLLGKGLADAAHAIMARAERTPMTYAQLAEGLVQRGRLQGQPLALAPTLAAALRAEVALAERRRARSRFLLRNGQVLLTEWLLPAELVRAEENASRSAERQRELARKALLSRINELPVAGFAELIATWLNGEGVSSLRAVRRPGSGPQEFHFAGTRRRGPEEERLAIVLLRGGRDIDRDSVVRVRGALHHYGNANSAWVITTGRLSGGAREEATAISAASVVLYDGMELACAMEAVGIGLRARTIEVAEVDFDLIEALGGDLHLPQAREPREREPREGRDERGRRRRRSRNDREQERDQDREQERDQEREQERDQDREQEQEAPSRGADNGRGRRRRREVETEDNRDSLEAGIEQPEAARSAQEDGNGRKPTGDADSELAEVHGDAEVGADTPELEESDSKDKDAPAERRPGRRDNGVAAIRRDRRSDSHMAEGRKAPTSLRVAAVAAGAATVVGGAVAVASLSDDDDDEGQDDTAANTQFAVRHITPSEPATFDFDDDEDAEEDRPDDEEE